MNYRRAFVQNSYIFITVVTNNRIPILINNINLLLQSINNVKQFYEFEIFSYCIMNDHIHCILFPKNINDYPKIIKSFKYTFTKKFHELPKESGKIKLWQNRYWEHTILSEEDLYKHIEYIHYNPVKHGYVNAVKDWEYSSFVKFVKLGWYDINWGNNNDIMKIQNMNCE